MPRCTSRWPSRQSKSRYFPRRRIAITRSPRRPPREVARHRPAQARRCARPRRGCAGPPRGAAVRGASSRLRAVPAWRKAAARGGFAEDYTFHPMAGDPPRRRSGRIGDRGRRSPCESFYDRCIKAPARALRSTAMAARQIGGSVWRRRWLRRDCGQPRRRTTRRRRLARRERGEHGCDVRVPGGGGRRAARRHRGRARHLRAPRPGAARPADRPARRGDARSARAPSAPRWKAASLLLELEPDSTLAREIIAALLANEGDLDKARGIASRRCWRSSSNRDALLMQLSYLFAQVRRQGGRARGHARRSTAPLRRDARIALRHRRGRARRRARRARGPRIEGRARAAARRGSRARSCRAQVLRKSRPDQVIPFYQAFVARHPGVARGAHAARPRARRRAQARRGARAVPRGREALAHDPQAAYAIGLLSLQLEDYADAQTRVQARARRWATASRPRST